MWILIMTLAFSNFQGYAGSGGAAVYKWESSIVKYDADIKNAAKWVCVQK